MSDIHIVDDKRDELADAIHDCIDSMIGLDIASGGKGLGWVDVVIKDDSLVEARDEIMKILGEYSTTKDETEGELESRMRDRISILQNKVVRCLGTANPDKGYILEAYTAKVAIDEMIFVMDEAGIDV